MKLPKLQELLNYSSKKFYRSRIKDLTQERDRLDLQIFYLIKEREAVETQIEYCEEVLGIEK